MPDSGFIAVFLIGLLGGAHCLAMCGGIVGALTFPPNDDARRQTLTAAWQLSLAYNLGRIASYTLAGMAMGAVGSIGLLLNRVLPVQMGLYILANLMLVALGLYLTGMTRALAWPERAGQHLWRRIQPMTRRFLPARSPVQAFPLGMLWGFLPCGMVYSALSAALLAGSADRGGALMLAFGLGTLPNLLLAGGMLHHWRSVTRGRAIRLISGMLVLGFGMAGLLNASTLGGNLWQGVVCRV